MKRERVRRGGEVGHGEAGKGVPDDLLEEGEHSCCRGLGRREGREKKQVEGLSLSEAKNTSVLRSWRGKFSLSDMILSSRYDPFIERVEICCLPKCQKSRRPSLLRLSASFPTRLGFARFEAGMSKFRPVRTKVCLASIPR